MSTDKTAKAPGSSVKKRVLTVVAAVLFAAGMIALAYRPVAMAVTDRVHEGEIERYIAAVNAMSEDEIAQVKSRAQEYNAECAVMRPMIFGAMSEENLRRYEAELCVPGTDVIGYLEIPSIDVRLPIYHNSSPESLDRGCGHLEGSSLPVEGEAVNTFLFAHRNLAKAQMFERLGEMREGDTFSLTVLKDTSVYRVQSVTVVDPRRQDAVDDQKIERGEQTCTLATCHPNGSTEYRLFVRGVKV